MSSYGAHHNRPHPHLSIPPDQHPPSFSDVYSVEVTPPPEYESFSNPWDNYRSASPGTPRARAYSTTEISPPVNGSSYITFPEPQILRSTSHGSALQQRPSRSQLSPSYSLHAGPSTTSIASTTSSYNRDYDNDQYSPYYESGSSEPDGLSRELSNLSCVVFSILLARHHHNIIQTQF